MTNTGNKLSTIFSSSRSRLERWITLRWPTSRTTISIPYDVQKEEERKANLLANGVRDEVHTTDTLDW